MSFSQPNEFERAIHAYLTQCHFEPGFISNEIFFALNYDFDIFIRCKTEMIEVHLCPRHQWRERIEIWRHPITDPKSFEKLRWLLKELPLRLEKLIEQFGSKRPLLVKQVMWRGYKKTPIWKLKKPMGASERL